MKNHTQPDKYTVPAREDALRRYNEAYRNGDPEITDAEYDQLWCNHLAARAKAPELFPADTILDKVGAAPAVNSGFLKVRHSTPMLSLDNVFEDEDDGCQALNDWIAGIEAVEPAAEIMIEPKIDGLSLRLTYVGGLLMRAVTRGSGEEGDDVSANVATSRLVPMSIPRNVNMEVNGEVFMDFPTFVRLNAELISKGEEPYTNPRNAAAGALRLHDPAECARRGLRFIPHGVIGSSLLSHGEAMTCLANNGFECLAEVGMIAAERVQSILAMRTMVAHALDYPIDGLVFKLNDLSLRERLGSTSRAPRWAIALKFQQEKVVTKLKAITVQVGRGGSLTPVAELHPVWVDGSTVSRATLHNEDQIRRLGLCVGDDVEIRKAGAVIPQLVRSVSADARRRELTRFYAAKYPEDTPEALSLTVEQGMEAERAPFDLIRHIGGKCPSCGGTDIQKQQVAGEDGARYICGNPSCPAQLAARIQHFCSRKCLDIEGIGEEMSGALAEAFQLMDLSHPIDLLDWTADDLMVMTWVTDSGGQMTFGESRAKKAVAALERAKSLPLHRWLFALGIPSIGENTSKEISRLCSDTDHLRARCMENGIFARLAAGESKDGDLSEFNIGQHIGPVSAKAICNFMSGPDSTIIVVDLWRLGIKSDNFNPTPVKVETGSAFNGKIVVITGTLSVSREEMKVLLDAAGAKVVGSVSAKTDFLVVGEKAGSKADKAAKLGVSVLTEAQARALL